MRIKTLQDRLREHIRDRIAKGHLTGTVIAQQAQILQGHLSNFLTSRRGLSVESMDRLLDALGISVLDLVATKEIQQWFAKPSPRTRFDVVPRISTTVSLMPLLPRNGVLEVHCIDKSLLRRFRSNDVAGRSMWFRFVLIELGAAEVRGIVPTISQGATLLVDRRYTSLEPYHRSRPNLYVVQVEERMVVGRVSLLNDHLVLQPCDQKCEVLITRLPVRGNYFDYVVGRVCQLRAEP